jgi:hypothetical protein
MAWALAGGMVDFYDTLRWDGREQKVESLSASQGLSLVPPPFTVEGRDLAAVSRAPVTEQPSTGRSPTEPPAWSCRTMLW